MTAEDYRSSRLQSRSGSPEHSVNVSGKLSQCARDFTEIEVRLGSVANTTPSAANQLEFGDQKVPVVGLWTQPEATFVRR
jgi:hypothetical protein